MQASPNHLQVELILLFLLILIEFLLLDFLFFLFFLWDSKLCHRLPVQYSRLFAFLQLLLLRNRLILDFHSEYVLAPLNSVGVVKVLIVRIIVIVLRGTEVTQHLMIQEGLRDLDSRCF